MNDMVSKEIYGWKGWMGRWTGGKNEDGWDNRWKYTEKIHMVSKEIMKVMDSNTIWMSGK